METISTRIVSLRKDAGLSQQQLADALNLSRRAVSLWETGRTNRGGGDDWGCLPMLLSPILIMPLMYVVIMTVAAIGSVIGSGIMSLFEFLVS